MIHRVFSTLKSFKELSFGSGLNLVVAEKSETATAGQTRNRAGKSSLVLLIHFALGLEGDTNSLFRREELKDYIFGIDFDLKGAINRASRQGAEFGKINLELLGGTTEDWPVNPFEGEKSTTLTQAAWHKVLGHVMFGISDNPGKFGPKFGMLFNYFARKADSGAFQEPTAQSSRQQPWDQRVALSFLIGLDWRLSQKYEQLRQEAKAVQNLAAAAKGGALSEVVGDPKQLRTQLALAQKNLARLSEAVRTFRVLPDYHEREREATSATQRLNELADANAQDRYLIHELEQAFSSETPPPVVDLERLYREAGVVLPQVTLRRYEEVRAFHDSVIRNRQSYLREELENARNRVETRHREMERLEQQRREVMALLRTHGALEHHSRLHNTFAKSVYK